MRTSTIATALLPILGFSAATLKRAGGPIAKPIPSNCTVINPLPHADCGTGNVNGYKPDPIFTNQTLVYQAYFSSSGTPAEQARECKQQCYGYGSLGECRSSFLAFNVPVPAGYDGSTGGQLETACLLFSAFLDPYLFVPAAKGEYTNATAASIYCPS